MAAVVVIGPSASSLTKKAAKRDQGPTSKAQVEAKPTSYPKDIHTRTDKAITRTLQTGSGTHAALTSMSASRSAFWRPSVIFPLAVGFRVALLLYGRWQDANSPVKYTDIDYLVFTDAARYVAFGRSPYDRATYRYTPLLAWILVPTARGGLWFEFGKALFAVSDIVTGWLIYNILRARRLSSESALKYASIWLLNPMVASISTRGSSEGLLAVLVVALLWATLKRQVILAGCLLGFGVHLKIYPFIYAASIVIWLDQGSVKPAIATRSLLQRLLALINRDRVVLAISSFLTFMAFNLAMFRIYGKPFVEHSYTYHLTRVDHRHNFSIYNTLLHLSSLQGTRLAIPVESVAFLPQLFLSIFAVPLVLAKTDIASTMLVQTFAFVAFNKVCTSQYFLWYMVFLPFYLPSSSFLEKPRIGITALVLWVAGQAFWLQQGYELEFLGHSTFVPGLWLASMIFFLINCWILGIIVEDVRSRPGSLPTVPQAKIEKSQ